METVRRIPKGGWVLCLLVCVACTAGLTFADWDPGDDYKMHFPQLPNLTGWDVFAEYAEFLNLPRGLADDWQCTESGPVTDIHFWGSWWQDVQGDIGNIGVGIFANNGDQPGDLLWGRV